MPAAYFLLIMGNLELYVVILEHIILCGLGTRLILSITNSSLFVRIAELEKSGIYEQDWSTKQTG